MIEKDTVTRVKDILTGMVGGVKKEIEHNAGAQGPLSFVQRGSLLLNEREKWQSRTPPKQINCLPAKSSACGVKNNLDRN